MWFLHATWTVLANLHCSLDKLVNSTLTQHLYFLLEWVNWFYYWFGYNCVICRHKKQIYELKWSILDCHLSIFQYQQQCFLSIFRSQLFVCLNLLSLHLGPLFVSWASLWALFGRTLVFSWASLGFLGASLRNKLAYFWLSRVHLDP